MMSSPMLQSDNLQNLFDDSYSVIRDSFTLQSDDTCENAVEKEMIALELNDGTDHCSERQQHYDGSDSGVDIATLNICFQRELSCNSGDYGSSSGGLDIESNVKDNASCGSSMISCTSDLGGENKCINTGQCERYNYEYYSENGSESSSVTADSSNRKCNIGKKKVGTPETMTVKSMVKSISSAPTAAGQLIKTKTRSANTSQTKSISSLLQIRERARSREILEKPSSNSCSKSTTPPLRSTPIRRSLKPDSLPYPLNSTVSFQRVPQRTPSITRARTPVTPSDDGRWPSVGSKVVNVNSKRGSSATPDLGSLKMRGQLMSLDAKFVSCDSNSFSTLPRRKKQKSVEDLRERPSRSNSNSRENKMLSSISVSPRKNPITTYCAPSKAASKVNYKKSICKTRIFHEISVQTLMTGQDLQRAFKDDSCHCIRINSPEFAEKQTQSDIRDAEIEQLREEVQTLINKQTELACKLEEKTQKVLSMEQQICKEREEKYSVQQELNQNTERVIGMLELARRTPSGEGSCDSLMMLESQIQMSGHELIEKQQEILKLRKLCRTLQTEMEKALIAQECLMQEKNSMEREANELQDFLQHEKTAMCDALNENELEYQLCKKTLSEKEEEIKVLRDECRHLVRLNEQRRQENKLMQTKYAVLESKTKDIALHQNTTVSGASAALCGLHNRLENLVEQLISSYNISEHDLEDTAYHNEAYPYSASSCDETPEYENNMAGIAGKTDGSLSPQRNQSFIAAVISAIRNATVPSAKKRTFNEKAVDMLNGDESDSTEMLDSETEPCLMMDNVLEDVTMPDSHSHNMVSSAGIIISQVELPSDLAHVGDESLHNLSQAITNRQQVELEINFKGSESKIGKTAAKCDEDASFNKVVTEMPLIGDYPSTQTLADQVIEVDNLITKLLKVLRLIQIDNDVCIQQLIVDKNKLQQNKEDMLEKLKEFQDMNTKLQDELMDATQELMLKNTDLAATKADIQRHRNEIDRLNEDICQLSTLCSQNSSQCNSLEQDTTSEGILRLLRNWNDQGHFADEDVKTYLTGLCFENTKQSDGNRILKKKISNVLNKNENIEYQNKAMCNALRALNELPKNVKDNSNLQQVQQNLIQASSSLPMYKTIAHSSIDNSQDINANDATEHFSSDTLEKS